MKQHDLTPPGHLVRKRSLHVVTSHRCQNNCMFCSDGGERVRIERPEPEVVRDILEQNKDHRVVCFSTHEPTLHPELVTFVTWARELGYGTVSLITNGRTLARGRLAQRLVDAGLDDLHVSIQGHEAAVHDAITRRPGSFIQALAGLDAALGLRPERALHITAHSTISALNLEHLPAMIGFFRERGVDHYGLNGLFIEGLAEENFDALAVPYRRIAEVLAPVLEGPPHAVSVSDIPPCQLVDRIPRWAIGVREEFHMADDGDDEEAASVTEASAIERRFAYGPPCRKCALRAQCDGVAPAYIERFGWDEFHPVTPSVLAVTCTFVTRPRLEALLSSPDGAWKIAGLTLEAARAQARLIRPGSQGELTILIEPLDADAPAYQRTSRYNLSLKGGDHAPDELALAEEVFRRIEELEED